MPLFHSGYKQTSNWNQPEVEKLIKTALLLRDGVNKLATKNTWELNATIRVNMDKFCLLSVRIKKILISNYLNLIKYKYS